MGKRPRHSIQLLTGPVHTVSERRRLPEGAFEPESIVIDRELD